MVQHSVKYSRRHIFIIENIDPPGEFDVGINNQRLPFIAFRDNFKEQLGACDIERKSGVWGKRVDFGGGRVI